MSFGANFFWAKTFQVCLSHPKIRSHCFVSVKSTTNQPRTCGYQCQFGCRVLSLPANACNILSKSNVLSAPVFQSAAPLPLLIKKRSGTPSLLFSKKGSGTLSSKECTLLSLFFLKKNQVFFPYKYLNLEIFKEILCQDSIRQIESTFTVNIYR